jgi:hypothetical protein
LDEEDDVVFEDARRRCLDCDHARGSGPVIAGWRGRLLEDHEDVPEEADSRAWLQCQPGILQQEGAGHARADERPQHRVGYGIGDRSEAGATLHELNLDRGSKVEVIKLGAPGTLPFDTVVILDPSTLYFERCGIFMEAIHDSGFVAPPLPNQHR